MKLLNHEATAYLVEKTKAYCLEQINNHIHDAGDVKSGVLVIERGGTGAANAEAARTQLELYSKTEVDEMLGEVSTVLAALTGVSS